MPQMFLKALVGNYCDIRILHIYIYDTSQELKESFDP